MALSMFFHLSSVISPTLSHLVWMQCSSEVFIKKQQQVYMRSCIQPLKKTAGEWAVVISGSYRKINRTRSSNFTKNIHQMRTPSKRERKCKKRKKQLNTGTHEKWGPLQPETNIRESWAIQTETFYNSKYTWNISERIDTHQVPYTIQLKFIVSMKSII